jgi:hypothetical protein
VLKKTNFVHILQLQTLREAAQTPRVGQDRENVDIVRSLCDQAEQLVKEYQAEENARREAFVKEFIDIMAELRRLVDDTSPHHEQNASSASDPAAPTPPSNPTLTAVVQPVEVKEEVGCSTYYLQPILQFLTQK